MKKLILLLAMISFSTVSAFAAEPLLLEPLSPAVLSTVPAVVNATAPAQVQNGVMVEVPGNTNVSATYANSNMIPQNAAAEGKAVPERRQPRVRVQTKQRSQSNAYWNAGGKGTKSFF